MKSVGYLKLRHLDLKRKLSIGDVARVSSVLDRNEWRMPYGRR